MLARLRIGNAAMPLPEPQREEAPPMLIVQALLAAVSGQPLPALECAHPLLEQTIADIKNMIAGRDETQLRQTVEFSIHASEAMAAAARITGEVRETCAKASSIAAGIEELGTSSAAIASTAGEASSASDTANAAMSHGASSTREAANASRQIGDSFHGMSKSASELAEAAQEIGRFVSTIDGLARQTNLLALNATIEAARAGEAGRGFAVVAAEVKALSLQTQNATEDIRARIQRLTAQVGDMLGLVDQVKDLTDRSVTQSEEAERQIASVQQLIEQNTRRMAEIAQALDSHTDTVVEITHGASAIAGHASRANQYADAVLTAVGASEGTITAQFAELDTHNVRNYVLHRAKSDHLLWKKRLSEMLVGINALKASELVDHHQCRLGKWYDAVSDHTIKNHSAFRSLLPVHESVHKHGKAAAEHHAAGRREEASAEIARMENASAAVLKYLDELIASAH